MSSYDLALKLLRLTESPYIEEARSAAHLLAKMIVRGQVRLVPAYTGRCTRCHGPIVDGVYMRGYGVRCAKCAATA